MKLSLLAIQHDMLSVFGCQANYNTHKVTKIISYFREKKKLGFPNEKSSDRSCVEGKRIKQIPEPDNIDD